MAEDGKLHIVMFPWLAFGHMIPYLELAKLIAHKGHRVSFVSTPRNIRRLPKLPPNLVPCIDFVKIPLPELDNLPENAEATSDVPFNVVHILMKAYDGLQKPMREFLRSSEADWILYDFAPYWVAEDAAELGIRTALFLLINATSIGFWVNPSEGDRPTRTRPEDFTVSPQWVSFPTTVRYRYFEILRIINGFNHNQNDSGISDAYRIGRVFQDCDILALRSCSDFEPEWLQVIESNCKKPVIPTGLLPRTEDDGGEDDHNEEWQRIREWLDNQEKGRVVYIAFGSEAKPTQEEMNQLAFGLEKSGLPFFWVFRARRGEHDPDELKLPEGFEERTKGRGLIWTSWAPQLKIIAHEAIGVFLSHSGWGSVIEAIQFEKSLVLFPCLADQGLNARFLVEKKMAYEIPRDEHDGSFTSEDVAESLKLMLSKEEGKIYREKVKEMKDIFANKERQDSYVSNLLNYLKAHRNPRK